LRSVGIGLIGPDARLAQLLGHFGEEFVASDVDEEMPDDAARVDSRNNAQDDVGLDFIEAHEGAEGPCEPTQLIISLLGAAQEVSPKPGPSLDHCQRCSTDHCRHCQQLIEVFMVANLLARTISPQQTDR
jgi:hypothetical protein